MPSRARQPIRLATAALAVLTATTAVAGCGTSSTGSGSASTSAPSSDPAAPPSAEVSSGTGPSITPGPAGTATATAPSSPAQSGSEDALEITIRLVGGSPAGGVVPVRVKRGQTVNLVGVSDTEDSLHVHGYDKTLEVHPGQRTTLSFVADVPGAFEIETHESEKLVAQLAVR